MSKPLISINFNELKINLYEVLGLSKDTNEAKIKKNFKKYVLELHPDKNPDSNEEIYNHVIIANQVLSNAILRRNYDNFLEEKDKKTTHIDLKNNFNEAIKEVEQLFPEKEKATGTFQSKLDELNKKHGYDEAHNNKNIMSQYSNLKKTRDSQINIPQEKINNNNDFNEKFQNRVKDGIFDNQNNGEQNRQIISAKNDNLGLGTWQPNDGLATLNDYSKLYTEDTVSTGSYTSLDMAFKIQKVDPNIKEKSLAERMEEYKNQTNAFNSRKPSDFSNKSFIDWNPK